MLNVNVVGRYGYYLLANTTIIEGMEKGLMRQLAVFKYYPILKALGSIICTSRGAFFRPYRFKVPFPSSRT
jgi:hypothetical protein